MSVIAGGSYYPVGMTVYPTPRSSTEGSRPTSASETRPFTPPPSSGGTASQTPPAIVEAKQISSLHTPRPSVEKHVGHHVRLLLSTIEAVKNQTETRSRAITGISLKQWTEFTEKYSEQADCRLEYFGVEKIVIVTCASGVHESFNALFGTFSAIIHEAAPYGFRTETNRKIVRCHGTVRSSLTPDLSLTLSADQAHSEAVPPLKNLIVFECAWSQHESDLRRKIPVYFDDRRSLIAVVCIFIDSTDVFANPSQSPPTDTPPLAEEDVHYESRSFLGPVFFENHTWAFGIRSLRMEIHTAPKGIVQIDSTFDLPPASDHDADVVWRRAEFALLKLLRKALGKSVFLDIGRNRFQLDRDEFLKLLDKCIQQDAYDRYLLWATSAITAKRTWEEMNADDDADDDEEIDRVLKRPKEE